MKHTPGPWTVELVNNDMAKIYGNDRSIDPIAELCSIYREDDLVKGARENAEFIVQACNSHEELLEAAQKALVLINELYDEVSSSYLKGAFCSLAEFLEPAINKAEGK